MSFESFRRRSVLKLPAMLLGCSGRTCDRDKRTSQSDPLYNDPLHKDEAHSVIARLNPQLRFQTMEGFGTGLNDWIEPLADRQQNPEFVDFYVHSLGASALRVALYEGSVPPRERWQDIAARDFLLDGDGVRAARHLFAAKALNQASGGKLRVIASVWSPPGWMKNNGSGGNGSSDRKNFGLSIDDIARPFDAPLAAKEPEKTFLHANSLRHDRYEHFAKSLVEWTRLYQEHGIELYGLSPQNEPRFSHWFGSAVYTAAELARLVETIQSMFQREGQPMPRLFAPETMTHDVEGNRIYLDALFGGQGPGRHLHALASHGYVDGYRSDETPESAEKFYRLVEPYRKAVWMTEGGTGEHAWPAPIHRLGASMMNSLTRGHAALITPWQALDKEESTHALMTLFGPTKKTSVATHFFRFVRPGMVRIGLEAEALGGLSMAAFQGPSEIVAILLNRGKQKKIEFRGRQGAIKIRELYITDHERDVAAKRALAPNMVEIPAESILTLVLDR